MEVFMFIISIPLAVVVHEFGHYAVAILLGAKGVRVSIEPKYFPISGRVKYRVAVKGLLKKILVAFWGPYANVIAAILYFAVFLKSTQGISFKLALLESTIYIHTWIVQSIVMILGIIFRTVSVLEVVQQIEEFGRFIQSVNNPIHVFMYAFVTVNLVSAVGNMLPLIAMDLLPSDGFQVFQRIIEYFIENKKFAKMVMYVIMIVFWVSFMLPILQTFGMKIN